jgi:hypothetical protein
MKNRSIAFITLMGLFVSASVIAQRTDNVAEDDTTSVKVASPVVLPKYAVLNGYHAGNYKQPHKARLSPPRNVIPTVSSETTVSQNYKMPHNKTQVRKVSAPASTKKIVRNYKMPYN